jgi:hypothetical protein
MLLEAFSSVQYFELFISETNFPDWADAVKMLLATSFLTLTPLCLFRSFLFNSEM